MRWNYIKACKHRYKLDRGIIISYDDSYPFISEGVYAFDLQASFLLENGCMIIHGALQGAITLVCQNCLQNFLYSLDHVFDLHLVNTTDHLPKEDYYLCTDNYLDLDLLLREEILLNIPSLPRHCKLQ
jgi:uncharacterized metal-binding protein YceD (DUF177 family)